jgi:hypothetical protein
MPWIPFNGRGSCIHAADFPVRHLKQHMVILAGRNYDNVCVNKSHTGTVKAAKGSD